jgi:hypothetical protein
MKSSVKMVKENTPEEHVGFCRGGNRGEMINVKPQNLKRI